MSPKGLPESQRGFMAKKFMNPCFGDLGFMGKMTIENCIVITIRKCRSCILLYLMLLIHTGHLVTYVTPSLLGCPCLIYLHSP